MDTPVHPVLRVGIDDAPPVPMQIGAPESGDFHGYEVDLLQKLAERLDFTIQYRRALWSVLVGELSSGSLDLVCSAATVTVERAREVDFCTPHLKLALALVTRADLDVDLDISTSRVGVRHGTTAQAYLLHRRGEKEAAMVSESNEELYSALARGKLDGVIDDSPIARYFSHAIPGLRYAYHFERTDCEYAVMTRLGNTALRDQINVTLAQMEFDGTLPCLRRIWFGSENLFIA
jgi:polar amino acid transport system substrate-binding protein